ncbi:hypothetical protein [Paraflavitalea speifideaquila]|uniref:hypothetical protein n=1 Tax=Paraflavitalea speifideaquila TaxID=3076558 RepID=UPI0028E4B146|nr:hypothetical protein [Paraflavitalea speifideiaquila]
MAAGTPILHNYPSVAITPGDIWFSPLQMAPVKGMYNLELYTDKKALVDWEVTGAAKQMMYGLLGEKPVPCIYAN